MATYQTYQTVGIREDLADIIYNISPTETPFMSGVAKNKATNTTHQWQTDALADVAANAAVEGDAISYATLAASAKEENYTQISTKGIQVSGTNDAVTSAGRNNELAYQVAKAAKELKRDMETALLSNVAKAAGDATTARTLGGCQTWIETNVDAGAGGSGAGNGAARVDGTQRAFTEDQLKGVLRSCYNEGGNPNMIMVGAFNKQKLSGFTGGSTRFDAAEDRRLITSIQDALILEMDYWAVSFLRDFSLQTPAQTRDADQRFMVAEYTLESRNEKASGMVTDLTTS
jgi:hypothetical protein